MFNLNYADIVKGLAVAVIAALLGAVNEVLLTHGFDFAAWDVASILKVAASAGGAYIVKNFFSDSNGKVFGRIG